jgi:hypothetical protein
MQPRLALTFAVACASSATARPTDEVAAQQVPALTHAPKTTGRPEPFSPALTIRPLSSQEPAPSSSYVARLAYRQNTIYLWVEVSDPSVTPGDVLNVGLFFPLSGTTARRYTYRFGADGKRAPEPDTGAPFFANQRVQATVERIPQGWSMLAAFPAQALPRFPASQPLLLEVCISYEDRNDLAGAAAILTNCDGRPGGRAPVRLPDQFRKSLKLNPPAEVDSLEGREQGWIGFARLHYPAWVLSEVPLTPEVLRSLLPDHASDSVRARMALPSRLSLRGVGALFTVLSGADPFATEGRCKAEDELRLGLYLVKENTARRVLDWPAATCLLGRALSVVLEQDGALTIGYTGGTSVNFIWSTDHFERTEIG